jgi:hypothetical protein
MPVLTLDPLPLGDLMQECGYLTSGDALRGVRGWRGALAPVQKRITEMSQQRAAAFATLTAALRSDEQRAASEAEKEAHIDVLKSMQLQSGPDGRGLYAFDVYGDKLELSAMTPQQRAAFEWAKEQAERTAPVAR